MAISAINQRIITMEVNPYPEMDEGTYLNKDLWFQVITGKLDLKMLRCIDWSRNPRYKATPEELYAISPDYINGRKMCYGMGKNKVVDDELFIPSPDHKIPETKGGAYTIDNLVIVPLKYNIWKRDMLKEDWVNFKAWMDNHLD